MTDPRSNVYSWTYDFLDRPTAMIYPGSGSREQYGYDAAGNPASYTTRAGQVRTSGFDSRNREIQTNWSDTTPSITRTFDALGRMTSEDNGISRITTAYDAANQITGETTAVTGQTARTLTYAYDGWNLIEERDAAGALQQVYVHGAGVDELLAKITTTGVVYYHADALGSTVALTNETGNLVESATYDTFGAATIRNAAGSVISVSSVANRFLFTGREWLKDAAIYDYRNRVYSPALGRFLQTDPIRFGAGDGNIYRYCENSATNRIDPFGLWSLCDDGGEFSDLTSDFKFTPAPPNPKNPGDKSPGKAPQPGNKTSIFRHNPRSPGGGGGGGGDDGGGGILLAIGDAIGFGSGGYTDRYLQHIETYNINVGAAATALAGGLLPKSLSPATSGRPPALGSKNPLTSVPRALGLPGAGSSLMRTGAAGIGISTVAVGMYNAGVMVSGFVYAAFPGSNGL